MNRELFKKVLSVAWPLIIANSFWNLQLTIDRIFLGQFSTESLGAAMTVMGVFWVPMALLQQTSSYITTFVAQYFGAKEEEKIGPCIWQALYVAIIGGVFFLLQNLFSADFFSFVGHSPVVQALEAKYFNALSFAALPMAIVAVISGVFTGLGQTKKVIGINFIGLIFNVLFDYLFIFGNLGAPALGIEGAGYATALASASGAIYGFFLLFRGENEKKFSLLSDYSFDPKLIKQFLRYGFPSGMQWAFEGLAFTTFLILMGKFPEGEASLSSSSIAVSIMMLAILPTLGVGQAVLTLVGQMLGEKKPELAEKYTYVGVISSSIYIAALVSTFWLIPDFYLSWFENKANPSLWFEVRELSIELLKVMGFFIVFDSVYINISFALKGAGDTKFVSIIALTLPWPFMVLPAYLLMGEAGQVVLAWKFIILYMIILTIILLYRFKQGKWKHMSVIHS